MNKANKVFLSLAAAQLASAADAKSIHSTCLEFSSQTVGSEAGIEVSNRDELVISDLND